MNPKKNILSQRDSRRPCNKVEANRAGPKLELGKTQTEGNQGKKKKTLNIDVRLRAKPRRALEKYDYSGYL